MKLILGLIFISVSAAFQARFISHLIGTL